MRLELHCHTAEFSSCSSVAAVDLIRAVFERGLDGLVITDHHHLWSQAALNRIKQEAQVPQRFLVLSGQEVTSPSLGDILVFGAGTTLPPGTRPADILRRYPDAAIVWAHPYRNGRTPQLPPPAEVHAVEIFNSNHSTAENSRALLDWHRHRYVGIAGTDTHAGDYAGIYPTLFDHPVADIAEVAREIRAGRCRPAVIETPCYGENNRATIVTIGIGSREGAAAQVVIKEALREDKWQAVCRAHNILTAIRGSGFTAGSFLVPEPYFLDHDRRIAAEEAVGGIRLHEALLDAATDRRALLRLAGKWLAHLHGLALAVTEERYLEVERRKLGRYVTYFSEADHPETPRVSLLAGDILEAEERLLAKGEPLVQGHGDFHPKNIFIQRSEDGTSLAAIDFDSSYVQPTAFDLGYFLTQLRYQFRDAQPPLPADAEEVFLCAYGEGRKRGAAATVDLYRARTSLNIASFLVWLGQGNEPEVLELLDEAEGFLDRYTAWEEGSGTGDETALPTGERHF